MLEVLHIRHLLHFLHFLGHQVFASLGVFIGLLGGDAVVEGGFAVNLAEGEFVHVGGVEFLQVLVEHHLVAH